MTVRPIAAGVAGAALLWTGIAAAQMTNPAPNPPVPDAEKPNAETPPGGIARGVVPPPKVDPEMVAKPPADVTSPMPVIKPPGTAR